MSSRDPGPRRSSHCLRETAKPRLGCSIATRRALRDDLDYAVFEADVQKHFERFIGLPLKDLEASQIVGGAMNVLRRHGVQIDSVFTVVNISMLVAEGLGKQLDPDLDLIELATPYLMEALAKTPVGRPPKRQPPG